MTMLLPQRAYIIVGAKWLSTNAGIQVCGLVLADQEERLCEVIFPFCAVNPESTRNKFWDHNPLAKGVAVTSEELQIAEMETKIPLSYVQKPAWQNTFDCWAKGKWEPRSVTEKKKL